MWNLVSSLVSAADWVVRMEVSFEVISSMRRESPGGAPISHRRIRIRSKTKVTNLAALVKDSNAVAVEHFLSNNHADL